MVEGEEGKEEEGGLGYHTSHSESLEVTERMEVPVSARSVRLDTLVVGLAAVDGDSAEPCVGQPGSVSERMPLGPMAWCWSLRERESGARPDSMARHPAPLTGTAGRLARLGPYPLPPRPPASRAPNHRPRLRFVFFQAPSCLLPEYRRVFLTQVPAASSFGLGKCSR